LRIIGYLRPQIRCTDQLAGEFHPCIDALPAARQVGLSDADLPTLDDKGFAGQGVGKPLVKCGEIQVHTQAPGAEFYPMHGQMASELEYAGAEPQPDQVESQVPGRT